MLMKLQFSEFQSGGSCVVNLREKSPLGPGFDSRFSALRAEALTRRTTGPG